MLPFCTYCGGSSALQCSHHITRGQHGTRWDVENATVHCAKCHTYLTDRPELHVRWIIDFIGLEKYDELLDRAYGVRDENGRRGYPAKPDRPAILAWLREEMGANA